MRVYVVVVSYEPMTTNLLMQCFDMLQAYFWTRDAPRYDPLKVYVNDEGLVRFATEPYSDSVDTLQSRIGLLLHDQMRACLRRAFLGRMMHLTNYSVNKQLAAKSCGNSADSQAWAEGAQPLFKTWMGRAQRTPTICQLAKLSHGRTRRTQPLMKPASQRLQNGCLLRNKCERTADIHKAVFHVSYRVASWRALVVLTVLVHAPCNRELKRCPHHLALPDAACTVYLHEEWRHKLRNRLTPNPRGLLVSWYPALSWPILYPVNACKCKCSLDVVPLRAKLAG